MAEHAIAWTGAACAIVGAVVVVAVPDASAAGFVLALCGAALTAWSLMRGGTPCVSGNGYTAPSAHDTRHDGVPR